MGITTDNHRPLVSGIRIKCIQIKKGEQRRDEGGTLTGLATKGNTKVLVTNRHVLSAEADEDVPSNKRVEMYQGIRTPGDKVGSFLTAVNLAKGIAKNEVDVGICTFDPDEPTRSASYVLHGHGSPTGHQKRRSWRRGWDSNEDYYWPI